MQDHRRHKSHSRNSPLPPRVSGWLLPPAFPPGTARTTGLSRGFDRDAGRLRARANRPRRARRPDGAQALIAAVWLVSSSAAKGVARSARSRGRREGRQDCANRVGILKGGDQAQAPAAPRASEHVDIERTPHQISPRPVTGVRRRRRVVTRTHLGGRARGHRPRNRGCAVGDHTSTPAGMRREHAVVEHEN